MKIGTAFGSYLKSDDLGATRPIVTIRTVALEEFSANGKREQKPILYFHGKEKGLVLNRTNANLISEILGTDETEEWEGHQVQLYVTKVDFQGKRVPAIRVMQPKSAAKKTAARPAAEPEPEPDPEYDAPEGHEMDVDDDIPF